MNHNQGSIADLPSHWLHPFAWLLSYDPQDVYPVAQAFHILDNSDEKPVFTGSLHNLALHIFQCYHGFNEKVYIFNKKAVMHIWDSIIKCVPVHSASSFFPKVHQQSMLMLYFGGGLGGQGGCPMFKKYWWWVNQSGSFKDFFFFFGVQYH